MMLEVDFSRTAQRAHSLKIEAESRDGTLKMVNKLLSSGASFVIEEPVNETAIKSLTEDWALIASSQEFDSTSIEDHKERQGINPAIRLSHSWSCDRHMIAVALWSGRPLMLKRSGAERRSSLGTLRRQSLLVR